MAFRIQEQEVARKSTIGLGFLAGKVPSYRPFRQRGSVMHGFSDPGARSCAEKYHRIGIRILGPLGDDFPDNKSYGPQQRKPVYTSAHWRVTAAP